MANRPTVFRLNQGKVGYFQQIHFIFYLSQVINSADWCDKVGWCFIAGAISLVAFWSVFMTARVIVINVKPDRGMDPDLAARKWKKINYSGTWTSFKFVRINIIFFL